MQYNLGSHLLPAEALCGGARRWRRPHNCFRDMFEMNAPLGAALFMLGDDLAAYPVLSRAHQLAPENADATELLLKVA